jgi:hypothetical protein
VSCGLFNIFFSDSINHILDSFKLNITLGELFLSPPCNIDGDLPPRNNPLISQKVQADQLRPHNGGEAPDGIMHSEQWIIARRSFLEDEIRRNRGIISDIDAAMDRTRDP